MEKEIIKFNLYNGDIVGEFHPHNHRYYINGKRPSSVTGILNIIDKSRPLIIWATELYRDFLLDNLEDGITEDHIHEGCSLHEVKKQEAASIGEKAHSWIESYIKGDAPDMPEDREVQVAINAFLQWADEHKVKFISSERIVYSRKHDYVGKMDIEAEVDGRLCLIDIKTSRSLHRTYDAQTAAYLKADEEESGKVYKGRWLIRLAKETESEHRDRIKRKNANRIRKGMGVLEGESYQAFEAKFLDDEMMTVERDFEAFLCAKRLHEWNKDVK